MNAYYSPLQQIVLILVTIAFVIWKLWDNIRELLIMVGANLLLLIIALIFNPLVMIATFSFKETLPIRYYNRRQISLIWQLNFVDVDILNILFDMPNQGDKVKVKLESYDDFFKGIKEINQPIAVQQTKKIADYLATNFGKDYKVLYEFMRLTFDYENGNRNPSGFTIELKLPNALWQDGFGDSGDLSLFVSGILTNWGISHFINIGTSPGKNMAYLYISTEGGTIIDPCCKNYNSMIIERKVALDN